MEATTTIIVASIVVGAYVLSTIIQIVLTKRGVSKGQTFFKSGVLASIASFIIGLAVVFVFLFVIHFILQ